MIRADGNFVSSLIISQSFLQLFVEYVCGILAVSEEDFINL